MFVPLSVLDFRDRAAAFFGDKIGVIDGDRQFTYREFAERTHRLAHALHGLGVNAGDRVSFITYNTHHLLEAYYGVLEAGAVLNPINIRLAPHEIAYILEGRVEVTDDEGNLVEAGPGDILITPKGSKGYWKNLSPVKKFWTVYEDPGADLQTYLGPGPF